MSFIRADTMDRAGSRRDADRVFGPSPSVNDERLAKARAAAAALKEKTAAMPAGAAPGTPTPDQAAMAKGRDKMASIGAACWLMSRMETHKHLFLTDLEWLVLPPIAHGQYKLWHKGALPVAIATWAYLGAEAEARFTAGAKRLAPTDWKSGETLWIMDIITPFGGRDEVVKDLRENVFRGRVVKTMRAAEDGKGMVGVEW